MITRSVVGGIRLIKISLNNFGALKRKNHYYQFNCIFTGTMNETAVDGAIGNAPAT